MNCSYAMLTDIVIRNLFNVIGILLAAQLWGYIADTRGRRKVIMYTMFISCACTIASSFVTNFWLFLVFRFLVGFL